MFAVRQIAAAVLLSSLAAPAIARGVEVETTSVPVRMIAVHSPADRRILDRRIGDAALEACGASGTDLEEVRAAIRRSSCYADAVAGATAYPIAVAGSPPGTGGQP